MHWYDYVRLLTVGIALMAMYKLTRAWIRRNGIYSTRLKDFWWAFNAILVGVIVANIENVITNHHLTPALFVFLFATLIGLKAAHNTEPALFNDGVLTQSEGRSTPREPYTPS